MNDLHGILFAYHSDSNLGELTRPRNTCSLPFGGRYRLIDFMLSSYVNAGISDVGLIVHESYQSLLDHVGSGKDWDLSRKHGGLRIDVYKRQVVAPAGSAALAAAFLPPCSPHHPPHPWSDFGKSCTDPSTQAKNF